MADKKERPTWSRQAIPRRAMHLVNVLDTTGCEDDSAKYRGKRTALNRYIIPPNERVMPLNYGMTYADALAVVLLTAVGSRAVLALVQLFGLGWERYLVSMGV